MGCQPARSDLCFSPVAAMMLPASKSRSRPQNMDGNVGRMGLSSSTLRARFGWSCRPASDFHTYKFRKRHSGITFTEPWSSTSCASVMQSSATQS